jgi:enediyne biosynthesis protein E4
MAVTNATGIDERGYSQGIAVGDFDNDGFDDIFVTNVGPDALYRNQGDGTFIDVTDATIGRDKLWGSSAAWGDLDLDGDLDLYVCNYVDFDPYHPIECRNAKGLKIMCEPNNHVDPVPDECFLNMGDGSFQPVARERGLSGPGNKALGVAIADFNNDGWPDIFVANDTTPNFLFINRHDGTFVDEAQVLGCAVSADGQAQANMGIAVGDYDRNGWLDAFVTHFEGEWNTLYRNQGPAGFQDVSAVVGLVPLRMSWVGFGTVMHDFNQDGKEELFVANGHLGDPKQVGVALEMPPQCFTFDGSRWHECSQQAGAYFGGRYVGRGVAMADFDDDGDVDLAVVHQNLPMALLRNDSQRGHWLKLQFVGRRSNRNAIGARATVHHETANLLQELAGGTSYCAAHQPILVFGLGESAAPCRVEIHWPNGAAQTFDEVRVDQTLLLLEPLDHGAWDATGGAAEESDNE